MSLRSSLLNAKTRLAELPAEMEAIAAASESEGRDLTAEEQTQIDECRAEFDKLSTTIAGLEKAVSAKEAIERRNITSEVVAGAQSQQHSQFGVTPAKVPAVASHQKSRYFSSNADAFASGMWLGATLMRKPQCREWCSQHGVGDFRSALEEGTDSLGGYTVPTPLSNQIIELVEQWGVYRGNARNVTLTSETLAVPKFDSDIAPGSALAHVIYPGEGGAITPADRTFSQVMLQAVKYAQLTLLSTELNEDSVINMIDLLVRDFARNFAYAEDLNSFLGDGTATYGGITGITNSLASGSLVAVANKAAISLADLNDMVGRTPEYAGFMGKYYMNKAVYYDTVLPLLQAAGGTDMRQTEEGGYRSLNGYPVVFTQVLPLDGAAAMPIIFGDLDLGCYIGTRRQVSIRTLSELYAANDQIGIIGTLRSDSVTHSVGTAGSAGAITAIQLTA